MAYTDKQKTKIFNDAVKAIKENNLFFIEDVSAFLPIFRQTIYKWWPKGSDKYDTLKDSLDTNKTTEQAELRKLFKEGQSVEKLALYKLICTDAERKSLSMNHVDVTTDGDKLPQPQIIVTSQKAKDNLEKLMNEDD